MALCVFSLLCNLHFCTPHNSFTVYDIFMQVNSKCVLDKDNAKMDVLPFQASKLCLIDYFSKFSTPHKSVTICDIFVQLYRKSKRSRQCVAYKMIVAPS